MDFNSRFTYDIITLFYDLFIPEISFTLAPNIEINIKKLKFWGKILNFSKLTKILIYLWRINSILNLLFLSKNN